MKLVQSILSITLLLLATSGLYAQHFCNGHDEIGTEIKNFSVKINKTDVLPDDSIVVDVNFLSSSYGRWGMGLNAEPQKTEYDVKVFFSNSVNDSTYKQKILINGNDHVSGHFCYEDKKISGKGVFTLDELFREMSLSGANDVINIFVYLQYSSAVHFKDNYAYRIFGPKQTDRYVVTFYNCKGGEIAFSEKIPVINDGNRNVGLWYRDKSLGEITVKNVESPSIFSEDGSQQIWLESYYEGSGVRSNTFKRIGQNKDLDLSFKESIIDRMPYQMLDSIQRYTSYKTKNNTSVGCYSNTIYLQPVAPLVLPDLRSPDQRDEVNYVCADGDGTVSIKGQAVKKWINGTTFLDLTSEDEKYYGVKYSWQYKYADNSNNWTDIENSQSTSPDLHIQIEKIKKKMLFRQKVYLAVYEKQNKYIYADQATDLHYVVYDLYRGIKNSDFEITPKEYICEGNEFGAETGWVELKFIGDQKRYHYAAVEDSIDNQLFSYSWKENENTMTDNSPRIHCEGELNQNRTYKVTVTDGCANSLSFTAVKEVIANPEITPLSFEFSSQANAQYENDGISVERLSSSIAYVTVKDEDRVKHKYYLVIANGKGATGSDTVRIHNQYQTKIDVDLWKKIGKANAEYGDKSVRFVKQSSQGCFSNEIFLRMKEAEDIYDNIITFEGKNSDEDAFICKNSATPLIMGRPAKGGFSGGTFGYLWEYTYTPQVAKSWAQIPGTDLSSGDLIAGAIPAVTSGLHIRRVAISRLEESEIRDTSAVLTVKIFQDPSFKILVSEEETEGFELAPTANACYGGNLYFKAEFNDSSLFKTQGYPIMNMKFYKTDSAKVKTSFSNERMVDIVQPYIVHAGVEFCQREIISDNLVNVVVGENLSMKFGDFSFSACMVEGSSIDVKVKSPDPEYTYTFYDSKKTRRSKGALTVKIPEDNGSNNLHFYVVKQLGEKGCAKESKIVIEGNKIQPVLRHSKLRVEGSEINAQSGVYNVCSGMDVLVLPAVGTEENRNVSYEWEMDEVLMKDTSRSITVTFDDYNKTHRLVRITRRLMNGSVCDQIEDTVLFHTYPNISATENIQVSSEVLCYGEDVELSFNKADVSGGSGEYSYSWLKYNEATKLYETLGENEQVDRVKDAKLTSNGLYKLKISDKKCANQIGESGVYRYTKTLTPVEVEVKPDLTIKEEEIKVTPTQINLSDFADGTTEVIVNVKDSVASAMKVDTVDFYLENALVAKKVATKNLNNNFIIKKANVVGAAMEFGVRRRIVVNKEKQCVSNLYTDKIEINQGFTSSFDIASADGSEVIKKCLNDTTLLSVLNLPKFEGVKLKSGSSSFQWKKKRVNSMLWTEIEGATQKTLSVTADKNGNDYIYACYLTYKNTSTSQVVIGSNEILVKGYGKREPRNVWGKIDGEKNAMVEVCYGQDLESVHLSYEDEDAYRYVWQTNQDEEWKNVYDTEEQGRVLVFGTKNIKGNIYIRCASIDYCGDTVPSKNFFSIIAKKQEKVDENLIYVKSDRIIPKGETQVDEVGFTVINDNANTYHWYYYPGKELVGNDVTFKSSSDSLLPNDNLLNYYEAGRHPISVYKVNRNGCVSDTISYGYELFDELRVMFANSVSEKPICHNSMTELPSIGVFDVIGGSGDNTIQWYYKGASMSTFVPLSSDMADFSFELSADNAVIRKIKGLKETTEFYAKVTSRNYPGGPVKSDVAVVNVYERLNPGSIDPLEETICYGVAPFISNIERASKGDGIYSYQWIKSEDQIHWKNVDGQGKADFLKSDNWENGYHITKNTFYRRVVSDHCTKDTSLGTKLFIVNPRSRIEPDEIVGTKVVVKGESAFIYGKDKYARYVFREEDGLTVLDTVAGGHPFVSDKIQSNKRFYITKIDDWGCDSENDTSFLVIASKKMDGGRIVFGNGEKEAWVCHNGRNADILNESEPAGENLSFEWYYCKEGAKDCNNTVMAKSTNTIVTTNEISLDTTGILLSNETGKDVVYLFYRLTENKRQTIDGKDSVEFAYSDTIRLHVVPTLKSVNEKVIDGLAGILYGDTVACKNASLPDLKYEVSDAIRKAWDGVGASQYGAPLHSYWEYTEGVTVVDYNASTVHWERKQEVNCLESDVLTTCAVPDLDKSYTYRVTMDDGCSSISTNMVRLRAVSHPDIYDSLFVTKSGIEEGDNVRVNYNDEYNYGTYYWYRDALCSDTLAKNSTYVDLKNVSLYESLYMQTSDIGGRGCMSEVYRVPLTVYKRSEGGKIANNQTICQGDQFEAIDNYVPASGSTGAFRYKWQLSANKSKWTDLEGERNPSLSAESVNKVAIYGEQFVRRVAQNEFGREVYSDTVRLGHYTPLSAGNVSFMDNSLKNHFCQYDTVPNIVTTMPIGGVSGDIGYPYKIGWEYSIGGEEYNALYDVSYSTGDKINMTNILPRFIDNRMIDNQIYFRTQFVDDQCGSVYGDPFVITVYQESAAPSLYQEKDSCNANTVTVSVENKVDYTYRWFVLSDSTEVWSDNNVFSKVISRNLGPDVTMYGVEATSIRTGCRSVPIYFNIDSLPRLMQDSLVAPIEPVCYGSDVDITQSEASGGAGEKIYRWQYSYDGFSYMDDWSNDSPNMFLKGVHQDIYVRRIVSDMCHDDTTAAVLIKVRKKISLDYQLELRDYGCKNGPVLVDVITEKQENGDSLDFYFFNKLTFEESLLKPIEKSWGYAFKEYEGNYSYLRRIGTVHLDEVDSASFVVVLIDINTGCFSKEDFYLTAHTAPSLSSEDCLISSDFQVVCNESVVKVKGGTGVVPGSILNNVRYVWYTSSDGNFWNMDEASTSKDGEFVVVDTLYVKRVTTNGCEKEESNVLKFVGTPLEAIDYNELLSLSIVTYLNDTSSVVKVHVANDVDFVNVGEDTISNVKHGENTLAFPAETYKNKNLSLLKPGTTCYTKYRVNPLSGGRLYMDGDGMICEGSDLPVIKATEQTGGNGSYTYQWQYRNEYVKEFVNMDGAVDATCQPGPVNGKTWYRRITYAGEYMAYSNEVSIDIVPDVVLSDVVVDNADVLRENGLTCSNAFVQKTAAISVVLVDTVVDAKSGWWESSKNNKLWNFVWGTNKTFTDSDSVVKLEIKDSVDIMYYRFVAYNKCEYDTSDVIKVVTLNVPTIKEEELVITPAKCAGGSVFVDLCDYINDQGVRVYDIYRSQPRYMYTYSVDNEHAQMMYYDPSNKVYKPYADSVKLLSNNKLRVDSLYEDVKLHISRFDMQTGAVANKYVLVDYLPLKVDFSFAIDGKEYPSTHSAVVVGQGQRVEFISRVENAPSSARYKWKFMSADNFLKAKEDDGYYSSLQNPVCYFYRSGHYPITLTVATDDCEAQAIYQSIYLPEYNVKRGTLSDVVVEGEEAFEQEEMAVVVTPNPCKDYLLVTSPRQSIVQLLNMTGVQLYQTEGNQLEIDMRAFSSGVYLLNVDGEIFKVLKK